MLPYLALQAAPGAPPSERQPSPPPAGSVLVRHEFPARGADLLGLTVEPRAVVTITGWDQARVVVQAAADGESPAGCELEFMCGATERGPLWVHAYDGRPGGQGALRIDVRVPRHFRVVLNAPRATVLVSGVEGRVTRNEERG